MKRYLYVMIALCFSALNACPEWNDYTVETSWDNDASQFYGSNECYTTCSLCDSIDTNRLRFKVEYFSFKPTMDHSYYAISSTPNFFAGNFFPDGKRHNNECGYKPGFRVGAAYLLCDCEKSIDLGFTYFRGGSSSNTRGLLYDVIGFPGDGAQHPEDTPYSGRARLHDHFLYAAGDLNFNHLHIPCCADNVSFFVGLHYAHIQRKGHFISRGSFIDDTVVLPIRNRLRTDSSFWGIGPQVGADYHYALCNSECLSGALSLFANAKGALLFSRTKAHFHYNSLRTGPVGVNIHNDHLCRVSPMADARIGARYCFEFLCTTGTLEFGYEFLWYSKCIDAITGYDVAFPGNTLDVFSNLNLQGPFVSLNVAF